MNNKILHVGKDYEYIGWFTNQSKLEILENQLII